MDPLCSTHSRCARIPITNPASYLKSTYIDTTNYIDLSLQFDIAVVGMTSGSFGVYTANSDFTVFQSVTTFNVSTLTMTQQQMYRNMTYDLDAMNENRSDLILYFEGIDVDLWVTPNTTNSTSNATNSGVVLMDNIYIFGRSRCRMDQLSACCYPNGSPTDSQLSTCWQTGCQYSSSTNTCDIMAPAFYQCIDQCGGTTMEPTMGRSVFPTDTRSVK